MFPYQTQKCHCHKKTADAQTKTIRNLKNTHDRLNRLYYLKFRALHMLVFLKKYFPLNYLNLYSSFSNSLVNTANKQNNRNKKNNIETKLPPNFLVPFFHSKKGNIRKRKKTSYLLNMHEIKAAEIMANKKGKKIMKTS